MKVFVYQFNLKQYHENPVNLSCRITTEDKGMIYLSDGKVRNANYVKPLTIYNVVKGDRDVDFKLILE